MVYTGCTIYGPYVRKDNRSHVVVISPDGQQKTVSYPKFLVECSINTYLAEEDTVDHIDGDFTNNNLSNLQVISRKTHAKLDAKRLKVEQFICPQCTKVFTLVGIKLSRAISERKRGKAGPFCTKSCAGSYGKAIQLGAKPLKVQKITPVYTTKKTQSLAKET